MTDINIHWSSRAIEHAIRLARTAPEGQPYLRIYIEGKGCDGFYYGVCFDKKREGDLEGSTGDIRFLIDKPTYVLCKDSEVDWQTIDNQEGFLIRNPRERNYRGKFFKRSKWTTLFQESEDFN